MLKSKTCGKIFIVGCPRSGTTLLQSLLTAHSKIASFPESHFFVKIEPTYEPRRKQLGLVSRRLKPTIEQFCKDINQPQIIHSLHRFPFSQSAYIRRFFSTLDGLTRQQGKSIWLEKSPEHLHCIPAIEHAAPDAKIVHIIRDGRGVVASLYELSQKYPKQWGKWYKSLDDCIETWNRAVETTFQHLHKANHTLVSYESLVQNPHAAMENLCNFLEVEFEAPMLHEYRHVGQKIVKNWEHWKDGISHTIERDRSAHKFQQVFTQTQQRYVIERLHIPGFDQAYTDQEQELISA